MALDFSSAKAWRTVKFVSKLGVVALLVGAAFAIPMNAIEGRPLVPPSFIIVGPLMFVLFITPWLLWWAFLRLSEMSIGREKRDD